ncbi:MAG: MFS transporter [Planctomycetota bacterium]
MTNSSHKLSVGEKFGYGLGDCAANFVFQTQLIFLMSFYTDVLGISAIAVGGVSMISRLLHGVNGRLMGATLDVVVHRTGRAAS